MILIWTSCHGSHSILCFSVWKLPGNWKGGREEEGKEEKGERRGKKNKQCTRTHTHTYIYIYSVSMLWDSNSIVRRLPAASIFIKLPRWFLCEASVDKWWARKVERKGSVISSFMNIVCEKKPQGSPAWGSPPAGHTDGPKQLQMAFYFSSALENLCLLIGFC